MNRRHFLKSAAAIPVLPILGSQILTKLAELSAPSPARRVRPTDPLWPSASKWERLSRDVGGRLIKVQSPLAACKDPTNSVSCSEVFREFKNPYYIGDQRH